MNQQEYAGTWIPREVMEDKDLSSTERILYAEISSFKVCYMSNSLLAARVNITERGVQKAVKRLTDRGYVLNVGFNGRQRFLQSIYNTDVAATNKTTSHVPEFVADSHSSTSIDNNKNTSIKKINKKEKIDNSELIQKLYNGWLIEFVIGFAHWSALDSDSRARELERATHKVRLTPKRKAKLDIRISDVGFDSCVRAIKHLANSPWHRGENDRGWTASIEWLFNSVEKVEEWSNKK